MATPVLLLAHGGGIELLPVLYGVQQLPWLLAPLAGLLVDWLDRRTVLRWALALECAATCGIAFSSTWWMIFLLSFAAAACQVVQAPARVAGLPELFGMHFPLVVAVTSATMQIADVAGQAVTGAALLVTSAQVILLVDALSFLPYIVLTPPLPSAKKAPVSLTLGFRRVWQIREIRFIVAVLTARGFTLTVALLSLPYALAIQLNGGVLEFGLLAAMTTGGLALGSVLGGLRASHSRALLILVGATVAGGLTAVPLAVNLALPWVGALLFLSGALMASGNVIAQSRLAQAAQHDERGQVLAAAYPVFKSAQVVGALPCALLLSMLGAGLTFAVEGVVLALLVAALALADRRSLRKNPVRS